MLLGLKYTPVVLWLGSVRIPHHKNIQMRIIWMRTYPVEYGVLYIARTVFTSLFTEMSTVLGENKRLKYCPHCDVEVPKTTFYRHRRLYYDVSKRVWRLPKGQGVESCPSSNDVDSSHVSIKVVSLPNYETVLG